MRDNESYLKRPRESNNSESPLELMKKLNKLATGDKGTEDTGRDEDLAINNNNQDGGDAPSPSLSPLHSSVGNTDINADNSYNNDRNYFIDEQLSNR